MSHNANEIIINVNAVVSVLIIRVIGVVIIGGGRREPF
jgi:hypothetical protein